MFLGELLLFGQLMGFVVWLSCGDSISVDMK